MKQLTSETLKQIISGLPKGYTIQVDGKACNNVNLGIADDGIFYVNFISGDVVEDIQVEHDGCNGCKYNELDEDEYPCNKCKQAYLDKYKKE